MIATDLLVVGGGPAGLSAAIAAARAGVDVVLVDRQTNLGGQLIKQTHKFFGSKQQRAGHRGLEIAALLAEELAGLPGARIMTDAEVIGYYSDGVVSIDHRDTWIKVKPKALVVATGASEKPLAFPNNDLPGIYGAGAVQTLMNLYGVMPGKRLLMVGAGNIGLIVSYQLLQAGAEVKAVVDAAPQIGGYAVHASKIRRMGVPIMTSCAVKAAHGDDCLSAVTVWNVNDRWEGVPGSERTFDVDALCLAVGLSPTTEILWQAGCRMAYIPELGGHVPWHDACMQTNIHGIFVAGDAAGVEEASSAMMTGRIAGLSAAVWLAGSNGHACDGLASDISRAQADLAMLRCGPAGDKIRRGIEKMHQWGSVASC